MEEKINLLNLLNTMTKEEQKEFAKKMIELINETISSNENINLNIRV